MKKTKKAVLAIMMGVMAYSSNAQAVDKGQVIIDGYIGGPQLLSRLTGSSGTGETWKGSGFGPFGGRVEYMFTPKSSIGLESNYASSTIEYAYTNTSDPTYDSYKEEFGLTRFRVFPRYALHFGGKKLDAYFHVGAGLAIWSVSSTVTDPSVDYTRDISLPRKSATGLAFRTGIGLRYFFTENIGINADFGFGGALFTGGITAKF